MLLDTRVVSPADRAGYWSAEISRRLFPMYVDSMQVVPFDARLTGGEIGPLAIVALSSGQPHRVGRSASMVTHADPNRILLYLIREGACEIEQDGRRCKLSVGELAAQDTSRPSMFETSSGFEMLMLAVPKWFLGDDLVDAVVSRTAVRLAGLDTQLLRLGTPLLCALERLARQHGLPERESDAAAGMLLPMLRGLLEVDDVPEAPCEALRSRMRRYALANLHDPRLGPEQLAREYHVSVRYVHKLFVGDGGVSAWIRARRLEGAASDVRETTLAVARIARRWGYTDAASFSRAFRRAHGRSPRELRAT